MRAQPFRIDTQRTQIGDCLPAHETAAQRIADARIAVDQNRRASRLGKHDRCRTARRTRAEDQRGAQRIFPTQRRKGKTGSTSAPFTPAEASSGIHSSFR